MSRKTIRMAVLAATLGIALSAAVIGYVALMPDRQATETPQPVGLLPPNRFGESVDIVQPHRLSLQRFVEDRLSGPHGVYTNLLETDQSAEVATGHETLSESAGLLMRYYALTKQRDAFEKTWNKAKTTLDLPSGFSYRYSPSTSKKYPSNAALDDLRIVRALLEAEKQFDDAGYGEESKRFGSRFLAHNVKDGQMYDFYDDSYGTTNDFLTLCYADFKTLRQLPASKKRRQQLEDSLLAIVKKGYLSDEFPFYETRYSYTSGLYTGHSEGGEIRTVESLLTILSLAEIREQAPESIRYLKKKVANGELYGAYTREGVPASDIQSTAIYAIAAQIGSELGDKKLYEDSIRRMEQFRVSENSNPLSGGYGDTNTGQAYSFDNLNALLAYAY